MSPQATFEAFRDALTRRAWNEAAELVHPAFAKHRQVSDLGLLGSYFASNETPERAPTSAEARFVVVKDGTDFSPYYARRVDTFPGNPTLGELASLTPREYLARAMAACDSRDRESREVLSYLLPLEILGVTENEAEAHIDLRLSDLNVEDEADATLQVQLRKAGEEWRIDPWATDFMAPTPWETR